MPSTFPCSGILRNPLKFGGVSLLILHPTPTDVLQEVFGFAYFRPGQADVIEHVLAGRSAAAVFPTGSGKSLCYQLPALMLSGLTLVVSPLIALKIGRASSSGRGA